MGSCKIGDVDINIVYSSEEKKRNILKLIPFNINN